MSQSWTKAHDSSKNAHWINFPSTDSPIVDNELNRNEVSVDTIDDRVITLDTTKAEQSDLLQAFKDVSLDSTTGVITFTLFNNTTKTIDTLLEKIAINFDYDDNPSSPHYQNLVIELEDGTYKYIDMSALITQYEFTNSSCISWTIGNDGSVTANIIDGSITGAKLQPNYLADCLSAKSGAENAEADAIAKALVSEGYANGKQNGVPVGSTSPYYHNNAEYFKDQASQIAGGSIGGLSDVDIDSLSLATGQALIYNSTSQMWENKNLIRPHLIILSETGSVVTATKGTTVISATETSTGHFECDITEFGTWTINAVLGGDDAQVSLVVDTVKVYTVDDSHFHADITVTFPSGGTCSCSKSGETTLYANTNPYTFTVHTSGTWTITATGNGETYTESVNITTSGQTESLSIPVGSTVTPTDSVATLLSCAGINDSNITTLADLFADSTTLLAVISSNNAIDYLVRSTEFAKSEALVPTMTSNTTPSGECISNGVRGTDYANWKAFDGNDTTGYQSDKSNVTSGEYIGYIFTNNVKVGKAYILEGSTLGSSHTETVKIQCSSDGTTWTDLKDNISLTIASGGTADTTQTFTNNNSVRYYRLYLATSTTQIRYNVRTLQFYTEEGFTDNATAMTYIGANNYASNTLLGNNTWLNAICNSTYFESVLNSKVPIMTGYTTPSGEVITSSSLTGFDGYKAFDGNISNSWRVNSAALNGSYIIYNFTSSVCVNKVVNQYRTNSASVVKFTDWELFGSNDNVTYTDIGEVNANVENGDAINVLANGTKYNYYKLVCKSPSASGTNYGFAILQFYGRVDV